MSQKWYTRVLFACVAIQALSFALLPKCSERSMVNFSAFAVAALCYALNWFHDNRKSAK